MEQSFIPTHIEVEFVPPLDLDPIDMYVEEVELERSVEIKKRGYRTLTGGNRSSKIPGKVFVECQRLALKIVLRPLDTERHLQDGVYHAVRKEVLSRLAKRSAEKRKARKERERLLRKTRKYKPKTNAEKQAEAVEISAKLTADRQKNGPTQDWMTLPNGHTKDKKLKLRRWPKPPGVPEQLSVLDEVVDQCGLHSPDDRELKPFVPFDRKQFLENERRHYEAIAEEKRCPRRV